MNATPMASASARRTKEKGWCATSLMAYTTAVSPTSSCSEPVRSHGAPPGGAVRGITHSVATSATATHRHVDQEHRSPPEMFQQHASDDGPKAMPPEATPDHMPSAQARSRVSVKLLRMMASVAGIIVAPPTPCSARAAINTPVVGAIGGSQRRHAENDQARDEQPAMAVPVAQRAKARQQAGHHQRDRR